MTWLPLTHANTGTKVYVNMWQIVLIAPSKTGGSSLVAAVREKDSARIIPIKEAPAQIADMLRASPTSG